MDKLPTHCPMLSKSAKASGRSAPTPSNYWGCVQHSLMLSSLSLSCIFSKCLRKLPVSSASTAAYVTKDVWPKAPKWPPQPASPAWQPACPAPSRDHGFFSPDPTKHDHAMRST
eukprot:354002-Amphidinium_carterae.1